MVSAERTCVISATARTLTTAEKMVLSDGRSDSAALTATLQRHAKAAELLDLAALAQQAGTVISATMLGAIAASGVLPFSREVYEHTIRAGGKGVEASLRGFALAFDAVARLRAQRAQVEAALRPSAAPDLRALGRARVTRYQDAAYAALYDAMRLDRCRHAGTGAVARRGSWRAGWRCGWPSTTSCASRP